VTTLRAGDASLDGRVNALVNLVQHTYPETTTVVDGRGLARFETAWFQNRAPRRRAGVPMLVTAMAAVALVAGGVLTYRHFDKLTYQVVNGSLGPEGLVRPTAGAGKSAGSRETTILFSEGSEITLGQAARARVDGTTAHGGRVVVESGSVRARIVHRKDTRWFVEAGPYTIRVTGTAFKVDWSWKDERIGIQMDHGSVVVTGPLAPAGVTLTAGMSLSANPSGGLSISGGADSGTVGAGRDEAASETRPIEAGPALQPGMAMSERGRGTSRAKAVAHHGVERKMSMPTTEVRASADARASAEPWDRMLARGEVQGILADAEARGIERVLALSSSHDLSALADAARYDHRPALARRALLAMRERFAGSPEARDAAFFLGGLAEDAGGAGGVALDWYDRYLDENGRGRYAAQALGRKMVMTQKVKGIEAARPMADEYLSRFPEGPYAAAARKLMREP